MAFEESVPPPQHRCRPGSRRALATGDRLQGGLTAAQCRQALGALALHQGPQRFLRQGVWISRDSIPFWPPSDSELATTRFWIKR